MIATLTLSLMGNQALMWCYGARNKSLPRFYDTGKVELFGVVLKADKVGAVSLQ